MKATKQLLKFSGGFVVVYLLTLLILSSIKIREHSLLQLLIHDNSLAGGGGYSLLRLREAEDFGPVDILFVGSSRCMVAIDADVCSQNGLKAFNLASTGQSPLNSYFLLEQFVEKLDPRIVVIEAHARTLASEGIESFYDTNRNMKMSGELVKMAYSVGSPHAITALINHAIHLPFQSLETVKQRSYPYEEYRDGGFVSTHQRNQNVFEGKTRTVLINSNQLEYLDKCLESLEKRSITVLLAVFPETDEVKNSILNYAEIMGTLNSLAKTHSVQFVDFSSSDSELSSTENFSDYLHLNSSGALLFSRSLIGYLYSNQELASTLPDKYPPKTED